MSPTPLNWSALLVFVFFFLLVTVLGFVAARWKSGDLNLYAIDLQLLGGIWILQIFPAVVFGLYRVRLRANGLLLGWFVGMTLGTVMAENMQLKPVYPFRLRGQTYTVYTGLIALSVNIAVTFVASWILTAVQRDRRI